MNLNASWSLAAGRWGLLAWISGGLGLEALHFLKSPYFFDDPLRQKLLVLAHAHGGVLSVLALVVALLLERRPLAARSLQIDHLAAVGSVLVPVGFLVGGLWHGEADPGPAILLTPVGAACWLVALVLLALPAPKKP